METILAKGLAMSDTALANETTGTTAHDSTVGDLPDFESKDVVIEVKDLDLYYGKTQALFGVNMRIPRNNVVSLIGPSGCGKSSYLRCLNRMTDLIDGVRVDGNILLDGEEVNHKGIDIIHLRRRVGMIFQRYNPFPKSIYENVVYGLRIAGVRDKATLDEVCESSLRNAALWDEVKDRLNTTALSLSGGQQQRLCIARAVAISPEVILMDEPCSALDPRSTARIESLLNELREHYTIVIVTHNMQQAARVSDFTGFLYEGKLIEYGETNSLFTTPISQQTEDYITGRFG
jgi:phosphate transport system ATP-binding protein